MVLALVAKAEGNPRRVHPVRPVRRAHPVRPVRVDLVVAAAAAEAVEEAVEEAVMAELGVWAAVRPARAWSIPA